MVFSLCGDNVDMVSIQDKPLIEYSIFILAAVSCG